MTQASRIISGLILLTASAALIILSWVFFQKGAPGAPEFPDERLDYGQNSGMRLYLPASVALDEVHTEVHFRDQNGVTVQDITISTWKPDAPEGTFFVVAEFREGARMDNIRYEGPARSTYRLRAHVSDSGHQYVAIPLSYSMRGAQLTGNMRIPALNVQNSRTSFASPKFGSVRRCTSIPGLSLQPTFTAPAIDFAQLDEQFGGPCNIDLALQSKVDIEINGLSRSATRIDYSEPSPAPEKDTRSSSITYSTDEPDEGFRARASFVDINREAWVQRYLFIAGVLVGLAAAGGPPAVQLLYSGFQNKDKSFDERSTTSKQPSANKVPPASNKDPSYPTNTHPPRTDTNVRANSFFFGVVVGLIASAAGLLYAGIRKVTQTRNRNVR